MWRLDSSVPIQFNRTKNHGAKNLQFPHCDDAVLFGVYRWDLVKDNATEIINVLKELLKETRWRK